MTTVPQSRACLTASLRSAVTTTPLPAASPSALTTYGGPNAASASSTSCSVRHVLAAAVGTPAAVITSLAKDLEPSIIAAAWPGPKQPMPAARTASAAPATNGASGPITTRAAPVRAASAATSAGSVTLTACSSAISPMPGLPGAACSSRTSGSPVSALTSACSLPPEPMTSTRTSQHLSQLDGLVPARADADGADRGSDHVLHCPDVASSVRRQ